MYFLNFQEIISVFLNYICILFNSHQFSYLLIYSNVSQRITLILNFLVARIIFLEYQFKFASLTRQV